MFRASHNAGQSFNNEIQLNTLPSGPTTNGAGYPGISASQNNVYAVYESPDVSQRQGYKVLFRRGTDSGITFEPEIHLDSSIYDASSFHRIVSTENDVYIAYSRESALSFRASNDRGHSFGSAIKLTDNSVKRAQVSSVLNSSISFFDCK